MIRELRFRLESLRYLERIQSIRDRVNYDRNNILDNISTFVKNSQDYLANIDDELAVSPRQLGKHLRLTQEALDAIESLQEFCQLETHNPISKD